MYRTHKTRFMVIAIVVVSTIAVSLTYARTWKSTNGKYSVEADFVGFKDGEVSLRKESGDLIQVPMSRLCPEDQDYVKSQASSEQASAENESTEETIAASSLPKKQWTYEKLVKSANCLRTASEVLRLYKMFLQDASITEVDREAAKKELPTWEERAKKKMVRIGFRWLTPEEAEDQKLQARQLVDEALRLIGVKQFDTAIEKLRKASKIDGESLQADFLLGLGYAIIGCDPEKANRHFAECVRRDPQHICTLNNLALTEVRLQKYALALSHWRMSLELAPAAPEVIQNLGRVLYLMNQGRLHMPSQIQSQFTDLYAAASVAADAKDFSNRTGWLYMGYYASLGEKPADIENAGQRNTQANARLTTIGSGTGFVVHPEYILTNRHVVEGGKEFLVALPGEENLKLPARVVEVANGQDDDLAIVHCKGLTAPPVPFIKAGFAQRGTEIMILGFPGMLPGKTPTLKSTRGIIAGLPDESYNWYAMDAIANPGNSGGPVCDATGSVLGILVAVTGSAAHLYKDYTLVIPHSRALPLLEKCILDYKQLPPNTKELKWVDVDGLVSRSTVLIWVRGMPSNGGITASTKSKQTRSQALEDPWCMRCSGRGTVPCPNRKCNKGNVNVKQMVVAGVDPATGRKYYKEKFFGTTCTTCNGKGFVPCPDCHGGIDKSLL